MNFLKIYPLVMLVLLASCATSQLKTYDKIIVGTDKTVLLEELGSPFKTKRSNDKDIWTYRFFENDERVYREIHLKNDKVVYKGESQEARKAEIEDKVEESLKSSKPGVPMDVEKYKEQVDDPTKKLQPKQ